MDSKQKFRPTPEYRFTKESSLLLTLLDDRFHIQPEFCMKFYRKIIYIGYFSLLSICLQLFPEHRLGVLTWITDLVTFHPDGRSRAASIGCVSKGSRYENTASPLLPCQ